MDLERLAPVVIGAFFGGLSWLVVGLFLSRRQFERTSRNAARAVYFELTMNEIDIEVAMNHAVYQPLRRGSFDRLLPELATWLEPDELETIVRAYMSHAGYEQAQRDDKLPAPVRTALVRTVLDQHRSASQLLRGRAFSPKEAARLSASATATPRARNA